MSSRWTRLLPKIVLCHPPTGRVNDPHKEGALGSTFVSGWCYTLHGYWILMGVGLSIFLAGSCVYGSLGSVALDLLACIACMRRAVLRSLVVHF